MNISDFFKQKMQGQALDPPPGLWDSIDKRMGFSNEIPEQKIPKQKAVSSNIIAKAPLKVLSFAVVAGLLLCVGVYSFSSNKDIPAGSNAPETQQVLSSEVEDSAYIKEETTQPENMDNPQEVGKANLNTNNTPRPILSSVSTPLVQQKADENSTTVEKVKATAETAHVEESLAVPNSPKEKSAEKESQTPSQRVVSKNESDKSASTSNRTTTYNNMVANISVPNAITPNGDGINDVLVIKDLGNYNAYTLQIFSPKGQQVLKTSCYENNWCAENVPPGTYFYVLKLEKEGVESIARGYLTVLK